MTGSSDKAPHTLRSIQEMLGLSRSVVMGLVAAGFVVPQRGPRNEYRFSFQDVVLLRTAYQLRLANVAPRTLLRSLRKLRASLPRELPMSGLRIRAVGADVAVREGDAQWEAQTGQMLLDLEVMGASGNSVSFLQHVTPSPSPVTAPAPAPGLPGTTAGECYERALSREQEDPSGAEADYRRSLQLEPDFADAYANLGALLCEHGRWGEAVAVFDTGLLRCADAVLLHFNRAIALEELERNDDALAGYLACLQLDASYADAHYNAARLLEISGRQQAALQHYSAYRRLQRSR